MIECIILAEKQGKNPSLEKIEMVMIWVLRYFVSIFEKAFPSEFNARKPLFDMSYFLEKLKDFRLAESKEALSFLIVETTKRLLNRLEKFRQLFEDNPSIVKLYKAMEFDATEIMTLLGSGSPSQSQ